MAKPKADNRIIVLHCPVELTPEQVQKLAQQVEGEQDSNDKIRALVARAVEDLAGGGMLLTPEDMRRIQQATGLDPASGEDLLPYLAAETGMEEGKHVVKAAIDPAYWGSLEEIAKLRGWPVEQVVQETVDFILENNWYEEINPQPRHVRMLDEEAKELEELLGGKFSTGTELAALIRKVAGGESLFGEPQMEEVAAGGEE